MFKISDIKSAGSLISAVSDALKHEGADETRYDFAKASEVKSAMLETKANEVIHTGNTGFGAELIPGAVQTTDFLDLAPSLSPTLGLFKGFHGRNMNKIMEVPIIGELALHNVMPETTDDIMSITGASTGKLPTAKVMINQKKLAFRVSVSDEEVRFSNVVDIVATLQRKLAESAARTTVSAFINGDTVLTANTNINLIDGTPTGTEHYTICDGLRKTAFTASTARDVGTLDFGDFVTALKDLGNNVSGDLVWLFGTQSHASALLLNEFVQSYINGNSSTVLSGKVPSFLGYETAIERYLGKTNAVGKVSATGGNNTKGQVLLFDKYDMQWGYNGEYSIEIVRVPAQGWQMVGYYYVGATSSSGKAGTDPRVASLYNIA
jgi:hypothetical protein